MEKGGFFSLWVSDSMKEQLEIQLFAIPSASLQMQAYINRLYYPEWNR